MAGKISWKYNFPNFNMSDRFTYFNDLKNTENNNPIVSTIKQELYTAASSGISSAGNFLNSSLSSAEILSAVKFLEQAATSEREKELAILETYKNKIQQQLPNNKDINKILNKLKAANLEDPSNLESFYLELTNCLNLLRQSAQDYKDRLDQIVSHQGKTFSDLMKDDFRFRDYGDIQAMLNNLIGMATQSQEKKIESFSSQMRSLILECFSKYDIVGQIKSGEDFVAIAAALLLDIENVLQQELLKQQKKDFTDFTPKELQKIINDYNNRVEDEQSRLQRALNGEKKDLEEIVFSAKKVLGISSISSSSTKGLKRIKIAEQRSKRLKKENSMYRQIKNSIPEDIFSELPLITFSSKTQQSHGNLFELLTVLLQDATKVSGSAATDILSIEISYNENPEIRNVVKENVQKIGKEYTKYTNKDRENRFEENTKIFEEMNQNVVNITKDLDNYINQLNIPIEDIFIYHESLKLYGGMETGSSEAFHGREMVILSYIDELYSLAGIGGLMLPQRDALTFLAANLSNLAVGGEVKGPLEHYFSLFAGLLMFDDVKNIALEASKQLNYKNLKNIHLYNLNGVYVPASMVLSFTYSAVAQAADAIASGYAAKATISTSGADKTISEWLSSNKPTYNGEHFKSEWPSVAESVLSGTKVQISFLASFIDLINSL